MKVQDVTDAKLHVRQAGPFGSSTGRLNGPGTEIHPDHLAGTRPGQGEAITAAAAAHIEDRLACDALQVERAAGTPIGQDLVRLLDVGLLVELVPKLSRIPAAFPPLSPGATDLEPRWANTEVRQSGLSLK